MTESISDANTPTKEAKIEPPIHELNLFSTVDEF